MRAFVTGIAGFAGSHLAEALLGDGWTVSGLVAPGEARDNVEPIAGRLTLVEGDLTVAAEWADALVDGAPDCVFHLAAMAFVPDSLSHPLLTYDVNVRGTMHILELLRTRLPETRAVLVSSADAYGAVAATELPISEDQPWRPVNPYAATKAAADTMAATYARQYGLHIVRARPFNHTGPRQSPRFVCADFARQIARIEAGAEEPVIRVGRLTARRDFSNVRDVVRAYLLLARADVPPEAYNICSEEAVAVADVLEHLCSLARVDVSILEEAGRVRPTEVAEHRGSAARLRETTGWRPQISFKQTLADTLDYWRVVVGRESSRV